MAGRIWMLAGIHDSRQPIVDTDDNFDGPNGSDPDPLKWTVVGTADKTQIFNNALQTTVDNNIPASERIGVESKYRLKDNFDMQVDYAVNPAPLGGGSVSWYSYLVAAMEKLTPGNPPNSSWDRFEARYGVTAGSGKRFQMISFHGNSQQNMQAVTVIRDSGKIRIIRNGNNFEMRYWDGVDSFASLGNYTFPSPGNTVYVYIVAITSTNRPTAVTEFNDFVVNSGRAIP